MFHCALCFMFSCRLSLRSIIFLFLFLCTLIMQLVIQAFLFVFLFSRNERHPQWKQWHSGTDCPLHHEKWRYVCTKRITLFSQRGISVTNNTVCFWTCTSGNPHPLVHDVISAGTPLLFWQEHCHTLSREEVCQCLCSGSGVYVGLGCSRKFNTGTKW